MFPLMAYDLVYTTNTNCGTGTASLAERPSSTLVFSGVRVARSLVFCVKLCISWLILFSLFYLDIVKPVEKSLEIQRRRVNNTVDKGKKYKRTNNIKHTHETKNRVTIYAAYYPVNVTYSE